MRLQHLDKCVQVNERRITGLLLQGEEARKNYEHRRQVDLLEAAERLQSQNVKLFEEMDDTEQKLDRIAPHIAKETSQVNAT